jgi:hypothetical protein
MNLDIQMLPILAVRLSAGVDEVQVTGAKTPIYKLFICLKNLYNRYQKY